jgi:cytochrome c peroxidase
MNYPSALRAFFRTSCATALVVLSGCGGGNGSADIAALAVDAAAAQTQAALLRNVAERPAFMHNGVFSNLTEVVRFYSTRNINPQRLYGPSGLPNDLPAKYLANIETTKAPFNRAPTAGPVLTEAEIADIVAFLHTLSDGFRVL